MSERLIEKIKKFRKDTDSFFDDAVDKAPKIKFKKDLGFNKPAIKKSFNGDGLRF